MSENRINIMDIDVKARAPEQEKTEKQEPKIMYASVSERFVALLIDYGLIFLPTSFIANLWIKSLGPVITLKDCLMTAGVINALFILYETIFSCGDRMTVGKALVGIAVMKKDGSGPISFFAAFMRAIGYYISGALLLGGFFLAFFDDRHRSLHDVLAGSIVVQVRKKSWLETTLLRVLGAALLCLFSGTIYRQNFANGAMERQYYIHEARQQMYRLALLEEMHKSLYGNYTNDLLRLSLLSGDPVQFQRDLQKNVEMKGFKIGITKTGYKISAIAKDKKKTRVAYSRD